MENNKGFINNFMMDSIENKFSKFLMNRGSLDIHALKNITLCFYAFKFINPVKYKFIAEHYSEFSNDLIDEIRTSFKDVGREDSFKELVSFNYSNYNIGNLITFIDEINLSNLTYKKGFDKLIALFSNQESKFTSIFNTPETICSIYKAIVGNTKTILDPACGTGSLLDVFEGNKTIKLAGQEINKNVAEIAKLRFIFDENIHIKQCDSLLAIEDAIFDTVVLNPPFHMKLNSTEYEQIPYLKYGIPPRTNANFYWLQYGLSKLNEKGKCIIILSNNSLFSSGAEAEIRSKLIKNGLVEAIISLPSNIFDYTMIPSTIWVLNKNRKVSDSILMVNALNWGEFETRNRKRLTQDEVDLIGTVYNTYNRTNQIDDSLNSFAKIVHLSQLEDNNYILTPSRYLSNLDFEISESKNLVELKNLLTPFNKSIHFSSNLKTKKISVKDLSASTDQFNINVDALDNYTGENRVVKFNEEMLIIAKVGDKLKPSLLTFNGNEIGFYLLNVFAFTINHDKVRFDYLIQELNKPYVYKQLEHYRTSSTVPILRLEDFLTLKINVLNLSEQEKSVSEEKEIRFQELAKMHGFENEIIRLKESQRKDLGSKKHNIMQHLNNVKSSSEIIRKMLLKNNGTLNATDVINPSTGVTVEDRLVKLQESIESVLYFVDNLTNEISFDKLEVVNLYELIKECVQKGIQNDRFEIIDDSDLDSFEGYEPNVEISKRDFEELYNNILENAINHGFINPDSRNIFRFKVAIINNKVELLFENNGKPFPQGMGEIQMYSTRGEKAGITANTGEGSWKVVQIAHHFNTELSVIDEPENEYPVGIKLIFKLSE